MAFENRIDRQGNGTGTETSGRGFGWKGYLLYYLIYTALFCVMAAAVFVWFYMEKRRFVWKEDGVSRHYRGLLYFSGWGKEVLQNFRETGSLRFPAFSLRMEYGADLYTTLARDVIGDPFSLPAVFVPEKYLLQFHDLMILARFWLAGITFSAYNFFMGRKSRIGVFAGAMVYIFNGFTLSGMRYPYFLNPFVFFPLLLIGCELYLRKRKPWLFLVMVFVTAVSNAGFFYMMMIMTVLYAVWRSVRIHGLRQFGGVILDGISFLWYGLIGTLLSSFILLPVLLRFLQDPRTADTKQIPLLWPLWYYRNFIDSFLSDGSAALAESWTYMGFGAAALLCVLFIFTQRKKHFDLKAAFIGLTLLLLTPAAGYAMNGFSYPANLWMWAYALLIGTMTAAALPELAEAGWKKLMAGLLLFTAVILVCICWKYTFSRASSQSVIFGLLAMTAVLIGRLILLEKEREQLDCAAEPVSGESADAQVSDAEGPAKTQASETLPGSVQKTADPGSLQKKISLRVQAAIAFCAMLSIAASAYYNFAPDRSAKVFEYLSRAQIETSTAADAMAASDVTDGLFSRMIHLYDRPDDNNKDALPFGFTANRWIGRQDYNRMSIPERQQALMQGILLERDPGEGYTQMKPAASEPAGAPAGNALVFTDKSIPVQIEYRGETVPVESGKKLSFESAGSAGNGEVVTVRFAGMQDCETGLYIRGLQYTCPPGESNTDRMKISVTGFTGEKAAASRQIGYATEEGPRTAEQRDFYVNMRRQNQPLDHFDLVLEEPGTYTFDSIEVVSQPMTGYAEQAAALQTPSLTNLDIHEMGGSFATDRITGQIEADSPQILCLQIPCTAGWTAYLDGNHVELLQADTMFSAILLPAGSHDIELRYQTPGLRFGTFLSLGTIVLLILFLVIYSIVSAVLRGREKRFASIPVGTYEAAENVQTGEKAERAGKEERTADFAEAVTAAEEVDGKAEDSGTA